VRRALLQGRGRPGAAFSGSGAGQKLGNGRGQKMAGANQQGSA
jgi:hypothetical protein